MMPSGTGASEQVQWRGESDRLKGMRLFVGIALSEETTRALRGVRERFAGEGGDVRWASEATWHVTLQFLGEASEEQAARVVERLRGIEADRVPVRIERLGFFERAGVFFAGVALTPDLLALQQKVTGAARGCGFEAEARAYQPHITLAKAKGRNRRGMDGLRAAVEKNQPIRENRAEHHPSASNSGAARASVDKGGAPGVSPEFVAAEFLLYESFPGPEGSRYEVRERFGLKSSP
jgi:RNA 2',3'-cyclic 3'-phosphodiesterase